MAQTVKNLPAMHKTQVLSLDWDDPLEKGMATHSSVLAWRMLWSEEPGGLHSTGLQRVRHIPHKKIKLQTISLMKVKVLITQSYPALCNPMDYSLPGSSVHGILQARTLEWVAMPSPRGSPNPGIKPASPALHVDS